MTERRTAVIIGAGPAGLTAAWELLSRSDIAVTVLEKTDEIGGLSRTVNYKGNRIDIGGHRFFSKSDRVMEWWLHGEDVRAGGGNEPRLEHPPILIVNDADIQVPRDYLATRRLTLEQAAELGLGFAPRGPGFGEAMKNLGVKDEVLLEAGL